MAQTVETRDRIGQVASLSAHEEAIGETIAEAMEKVGKDGVITVEESKGLSDEIEYVEGMQVDRGYISPYFITNPDRMESVLEDAFHHHHRQEGVGSGRYPSRPGEAPPDRQARTLSLSPRTWKAKHLATLVVNKLRGTLNCPGSEGPRVRRPTQGNAGRHRHPDRRHRHQRRDRAQAGLGHHRPTWVSARRVSATKDECTFVEGRGSEENIKARINQIKAQIEDTTSEFDREKLQERMAKLSGGVAVIKVGAATEIELKERKARVEDALSATRSAVEEGIVPGWRSCPGPRPARPGQSQRSASATTKRSVSTSSAAPWSSL